MQVLKYRIGHCQHFVCDSPKLLHHPSRWIGSELRVSINREPPEGPEQRSSLFQERGPPRFSETPSFLSHLFFRFSENILIHVARLSLHNPCISMHNPHNILKCLPYIVGVRMYSGLNNTRIQTLHTFFKRASRPGSKAYS